MKTLLYVVNGGLISEVAGLSLLHGDWRGWALAAWFVVAIHVVEWDTGNSIRKRMMPHLHRIDRVLNATKR